MAWRAISQLLTIPRDRPELMVAQARAYSRYVPVIYFVALTNAVALALTHYTTAPWPLTIGAVGVLAAAFGVRTSIWLRSRQTPLDAERAYGLLAGTVRLGLLLGIAFSGWALALYQYGDAYARAHVAFFVAMSVITAIFCMVHIRAAALAVTASAVLPTVVFFFATGEPALQAIGVNIAMVGAAMIFALLHHYDEFAALVESRAAIALQAEEARRLSAENKRLANQDALTGLPNRRNFLATLDLEFARARETQSSLVVGLIDLDGFKPVNDAFGHAMGDRLLIEVGNRLRSFSHYPMFFARLGGDEFGIIVSKPVNEEELQGIGNKICEALRRPFDLPGVTAQIGASLGLCALPLGGESAEQMFERADFALYHAKQNLRGAAIIFNDRHASEVRELSRVEQALQRANLSREMTVAFQPVVDIASGRTTGFEALARWNSSELGEVPPGRFIRAAERSGQISQVTQHLVHKALSAARTWPMDARVAINLSARDVASIESIHAIIKIVHNSLVAAHRIDFEVTETAIVGDFEQARNALVALRATGAQIALDDFGTGHSSLSHVRLLPIDALKVDASFVADIEHHRPSEDIVKTVLELCRNMRLRCIVEGVENSGQLEKIRELGANHVQGFHFARPMPEGDVAGYLNGEALRARADAAAQQEQRRLRA